jgi:Leucine-rich repeat (LRR) protein
MPEVFALNLQRNEINEIILDTSEKLSPLKYLILDYNKIDHLGSDTFRGFFNLKLDGKRTTIPPSR